MIEFSSKFTSEKVLLRREYRARLKQADSKAKELENSLWLLLYRLGFTQLNVDGPSNITFGRNAQSAQKKAIDVIADSTLARIYVECTTQKKPSPKVAKWIAEVSEIRKWDHDGNAGVNVGFVFVCTSEISDSERKQLANAGITLLTSNDLDYFEELRRQYESLAYYQLLSVVFKKKKIVAMNERELEVPAIKCKYNKTSNCYLFGVHPATLIPLASVLHRAGHRSMEVVNAYQRLIKKGKIKSLKTYIK